MQFLGRHIAGRVRQGKRSRCVAEELDGESAVDCLPGSRVAAHVRHVSSDRHRVHVSLPQPIFERCAREAPGRALISAVSDASSKYISLTIRR